MMNDQDFDPMAMIRMSVTKEQVAEYLQDPHFMDFVKAVIYTNFCSVANYTDGLFEPSSFTATLGVKTSKGQFANKIDVTLTTFEDEGDTSEAH